MKKMAWILVVVLIFTLGLGLTPSACGEETLMTDLSELIGCWETAGAHDSLASHLIFTADHTAVMYDLMPVYQDLSQENLCIYRGAYEFSQDGTLVLDGTSYKVYVMPLDADEEPSATNQIMGRAIFLFEISDEHPEGNMEYEIGFVPVSDLVFLPTAQVLTGASTWTDLEQDLNYHFLPDGTASLYARGKDDVPISEGTWSLGDDSVLTITLGGVETAYQTQYFNVEEDDEDEAEQTEAKEGIHTILEFVLFSEEAINLYGPNGEEITLWKEGHLSDG